MAIGVFSDRLASRRRAAPRSSSSQRRAPLGRPASTSDSLLFVRHYSGTPSWFLLLPIVICLSSRGTLLLPDAMVRTWRSTDISLNRLLLRQFNLGCNRLVRLSRSFLPGAHQVLCWWLSFGFVDPMRTSISFDLVRLSGARSRAILRPLRSTITSSSPIC